MSEYRYILQSVPDGEFIDLDAPLTGVQIIQTVNGAGDISGTLPVQYSALKKPNGQLAITEYGTMLHVELDGEILQSGIVDNITINNNSLQIGANGWSGYTDGQPYLGKKKTYISADPAMVIRDCWDYLLSFPDSLPDVSIDIIKTGTTVGKPEGRNLTNAKTKLNAEKRKLEQQEKAVQVANTQVIASKKAVYVAAKRLSVGEIVEQSSQPSGKKAQKNNIWRDTDNGKIYFYRTSWMEITYDNAEINTAITNYRIQKSSYDAAVKKVTDQKAVIKGIEDRIRDLSEEEAEPLILSWDTTDDIQKVIGEMVEAGSIQYREQSRWVGDEIHHRLEIGSPRLGARRENVRFEIGYNVTAVPSVSFTEYASGLILFGSGEGDKRIRTERHKNTGKLRRVTTQTEPQATSKAKADSAAETYLKSAQVARSVDRIQITDSSLAEFGTFKPGDEVRVIGSSGWSEDLDIWVLIKSINFSPDGGNAELEVQLA
ncbi:hypothetical protein [Glutamicibacter sp. TV12E]|uniref:hypothetical protein n=1 Tax=Glutamicibacter sp. TV12E TaxID=3446362 RepID=UPI004034738F